MALGRARRFESVNYWPGFVDALSTMLLVMIFMLSVFMLAQFYLSREVSGKDTAMAKLNRQIEELTNLLAMERTAKADAQSGLGLLSATLDASRKEQARLQGLLAQNAASAEAVGGKASAEAMALDAQKEVSARALAQVDILNQQIAALRRQLAAIEDALSASEAAGKDAQTKIADLGARLNTALAQKVQELARYRSDFFGRLRQILGSRPGIRVVGDRFVFESSVLFEFRQGGHQPGRPPVARRPRRRGHRSRARNPARPALDPAHRRPYRPAADLRRPVPLELGAFLGARDRGGAISHHQGDSARAARRGRLRGIPADRPRPGRRGARPQPADRAEADRAVSLASAPYSAASRPRSSAAAPASNCSRASRA